MFLRCQASWKLTPRKKRFALIELTGRPADLDNYQIGGSVAVRGVIQGPIQRGEATETLVRQFYENASSRGRRFLLGAARLCRMRSSVKRSANSMDGKGRQVKRAARRS